MKNKWGLSVFQHTLDERNRSRAEVKSPRGAVCFTNSGPVTGKCGYLIIDKDDSANINISARLGHNAALG